MTTTNTTIGHLEIVIHHETRTYRVRINFNGQVVFWRGSSTIDSSECPQEVRDAANAMRGLFQSLSRPRVSP